MRVIEWAAAATTDPNLPATTRRILTGFALVALEIGKVSFGLSYRQIAEAAGVSVGTVAKHEAKFRAWVYPTRRGHRFKGDATVWRLNLRRAHGNKTEASLSGKGGLFPTARPADNYWHRWPSGYVAWEAIVSLADSFTVADIMASGVNVHPGTVRRNLRRFERDGLVIECEGRWSVVPGARPELLDGLVDHDTERRARHQADRVRRAAWVAGYHDAHDVVDLAQRRAERERTDEARPKQVPPQVLRKAAR